MWSKDVQPDKYRVRELVDDNVWVLHLDVDNNDFCNDVAQHVEGKPPISTMFGAWLVNCSTEGGTESAASVVAETIDNDNPESISVPPISAPLSRSETSNCFAPFLEGNTTPETYLGNSVC